MSLNIAKGSTITMAEAQRTILLNVVGLCGKIIANQISAVNGMINTVRNTLY